MRITRAVLPSWPTTANGIRSAAKKVPAIRIAIIVKAKDQVNDLLAFIRKDPKVELCYLVLVQG